MLTRYSTCLNESLQKQQNNTSCSLRIVLSRTYNHRYQRKTEDTIWRVGYEFVLQFLIDFVWKSF